MSLWGLESGRTVEILPRDEEEGYAEQMDLGYLRV